MVNLFVSTIRSGLSATSWVLNQQKENIKNVAGITTFIFGACATYHIVHLLQERRISTEEEQSWVQTANKIILLLASISLILSAATSRFGVALISAIIHPFFTSQQLAKVFGPNLNFATNPYHPRHVASLAAVILALPCLSQTFYLAANWAYRKISPFKEKEETSPISSWLTDQKIRLMLLFSFLTSRPVLHIGNQLVSRIIARS